MTWRYVNRGDVHDLTQTPSYLTNLPDTQSKTGVAFYQTTRAKCFDLPATPEIWAKFDVYFDGSNRWRAYNGGSNGITGITAQASDGLLSLFANEEFLQNTSNICIANTLQTVLLHMVSGTNGLIEAWVDGTKIYTYNGDVNHGDDFADFYLQSDGAGTFFSNVIISNGEVGEGEGVEILKPVVAITVINPELEPPSQPHFNFSGTQYAVLPIMMANATTFTLEVKFSTTATQSNSYWADFPTLIGTRPNIWDYNVMLGVYDDRLGFYVNKPDSLWYTPWVMCGINDGNIHKATLTVDRDAGTISLTCDGYTCTYTGRAQINPNYNLQIANVYGNTYLPCNIYEARVWSVARAGWGEIDGSEEGLECWLLPTQDGLRDYSGNDRHATLYGDPLYVGEESFTFDIERRLINNVTATAAIERRIKNGDTFTFAVERRIKNAETFTFAVERRIKNAETFTFAVERRIKNADTFSFDVQRLIQNRVEATFAVEREIISPLIEVDIDFAVQRRVIREEPQSYDVERRIVNATPLRYAVSRKVINGLTRRFAIELRQALPVELTFDVERQIIHVEENVYDVERQLTYDGLLTKILPDSILGDPKMYASAVALDQQLISIFADVRQVLHIPRLDELEGVILDLLNWQLHTDFYEPLHLSDKVKRDLIRQSIGWHRIKGTKAAVENLCAVAFRESVVEEWFDYGGEPYRFRITSKGFAITPDGFNTFKRLIDSAKSVRSHLDGIRIDYSPPNPLTYYVGIARFRAGTHKLHHPKPRDIESTLRVGLAQYHAGSRNLLHPKPKDIRCTIFIKCVRSRVGRIFIGQQPPPTPKPTNYRLPIAVLFSRRRTGRIIHKVKSDAAADVDEPFPYDEDSCNNHFIWFRLNGLYSKRAFKLRNAREDVTKDELKEVADYIIKNRILFTTKDDLVIKRVRASVVHVTEENIPLNDDLPGDLTPLLPKAKELITYG